MIHRSDGILIVYVIAEHISGIAMDVVGQVMRNRKTTTLHSSWV